MQKGKFKIQVDEEEEDEEEEEEEDDAAAGQSLLRSATFH